MKLINSIISLNRWYDNLTDPIRFFVFVLFIAIPFSILLTLAPIIWGFYTVILILLRLFRYKE